MTEQITLNVNGMDYSVDVDTGRNLLGVLRTEIGLTGTKEGLRRLRVRRMHGAARWSAGELVFVPGDAGPRQIGDDHRRRHVRRRT